MKLTNKNGKYNLELNKFELQCLFLVAGNSCGQGQTAIFLYNLYDNIADNIDKNGFRDAYEYHTFLTLRSGFSAKVEVSDNLPKNSFDSVKKQSCSFYYPKENYRREKTYDVRKLEYRELKDGYEQGNYLIGFDNGIDGKIKKFRMDLVVDLKYNE
jgi:hypothetical protein